ncbi:hypothetical protein [Amycolatopsis sp. cmx-4-54]|uniref:hypothetical protein n=1 Tax=Amycolatopsis sp. cmx-4-54 TaxID=2790936 RepID=UPI00397D2363
MARKPLPLGTHGEIRLYGNVDGRWVPKTKLARGIRLPRWRAVANYRNHAGETRQVERSGVSATDASNNLLTCFAEMNAARAITVVADAGASPTAPTVVADAGASPTALADTAVTSADRYLLSLLSPVPLITPGKPLTVSSRVIEAIPAFLERIREECAPTTVDRYVVTLKTHIIPGIGQLLFTECTVSRLQQFEAGLRSKQHLKPQERQQQVQPKKLAPTTRRVVREVTRGLLQIGVEAGILTHNPVKSMRRIVGGPQNAAKAVTVAAVPSLFAKIDGDKLARDADLPTITRALFGLGTRLGETMALSWQYINLSDEPITRTVFAGTPREETRKIPPKHLWINATITEPVGLGTQRTPVKTKRSNRIVAIPQFLQFELELRKSADVAEDAPVFPHPLTGAWRTSKDVGNALYTMRRRIGVPDFKSHVGRKTASTVLYESGFRGDDLADQFGHATGDFTRTHYVDAGTANPQAADILDRALSGASGFQA